MNYEIFGETIKSATSLKLGEIFGKDTIRYKENVTKMSFPNFYINQLNINITPAGKTRLQLDYLMNIQYRVAENTENITNLQQQLDNIGLKLCSELQELNLERPTKTYDRYYQKSDGVLQFFFNIRVFVIPAQTEIDKFKRLKLYEEVL